MSGDLRDRLDAIADASPAPTGAKRDVEIQAAVTRGLATPADALDRGLASGASAAAGARWWRWGIVAGTVAAVAALLVWMQLRERDPDHQVAVVHDAGAGSQIASIRDAGVGSQIASIHDAGVGSDPSTSNDVPELVVERGIDAPVGALVEARELTVLRNSDGTRVEANAGTKLTRETRDAKKWRLEQGQLALRVAPNATLEVATPEAKLVVVGSQFIVGRYASETTIEVQVGDVLVTPTDGEPVTVHAGERWPAERPVEPVVIDAGVVKPRDAGAKVPVLQLDATIIRKTIRSGDVGGARQMIEAQRAQQSSKRALAELGILAAEADLAERKTKSAIAKYLDVVASFASTPQAEQALFAAAQLAIDRPDAGYKPEALLRDYLDAYPKGQFAKDAARLLDSLKK